MTVRFGVRDEFGVVMWENPATAQPWRYSEADLVVKWARSNGLAQVAIECTNDDE